MTMIEPHLLEQVAWLELAAARGYTNVGRRQWGYLLHNQSNPDNHTANCARSVRTALPEAFIDEIVQFYRDHRILPRVKVNDLSEPGDLVWRLGMRGFRSADTSCVMMRWEPGSSEGWPGPVSGPEAVAPDEARIEPAGPADVPDIARIRADANGHGIDWVERQTGYQMASRETRYYLAWLDGRAVACAAVIRPAGEVVGEELPGLVDHVATRPEFRGRGLTTAIVRRIQADSSRPLYLLAAYGAAEGPYRKTGFLPVGVHREITCWLDA